jgi:hypothetical protein
VTSAAELTWHTLPSKSKSLKPQLLQQRLLLQQLHAFSSKNHWLNQCSNRLPLHSQCMHWHQGAAAAA